MKRLWIIFLLLGGCSSPSKYHPVTWIVGQWVSYTINDEPLKISIVSEDSALFWLETAEPGSIVKILVEENRISRPRRLIIKKLNESPVEFPLNQFSVESNLPIIKIDEFTDLKKEILTLPRGKFKVFHIKRKEEDVWLSNKVPILGIARYESVDRHIVLCDYGLTGAESEIKEKPKMASFAVE
ncbi:hypothetical protein KAW65_07985 [candidate division WOR-3 bacterium]|nr:hypothetical protein [candidate division WOR-3 bacterium]